MKVIVERLWVKTACPHQMRSWLRGIHQQPEYEFAGGFWPRGVPIATGANPIRRAFSHFVPGYQTTRRRRHRTVNDASAPQVGNIVPSITRADIALHQQQPLQHNYRTATNMRSLRPVAATAPRIGGAVTTNEPDFIDNPLGPGGGVSVN